MGDNSDTLYKVQCTKAHFSPSEIGKVQFLIWFVAVTRLICPRNDCSASRVVVLFDLQIGLRI